MSVEDTIPGRDAVDDPFPYFIRTEGSVFIVETVT